MLGVDTEGVTVAIQTMPPFPWHFGGQSHHNLFVDPDEIVTFANEAKVGICLDLSHSQMACHYHGWSLKEFVKTVAPHVVHIHISDAKGDDGEGVQMGKGDIDFAEISKVLKNMFRMSKWSQRSGRATKTLERVSGWPSNFLRSFFLKAIK